MRDAYASFCLVIGVGLVGAQALITMKRKPARALASKIADAAGQVSAASFQTVIAASQTVDASGQVATAHAKLTVGQPASTDEVASSVRAAAAATSAAHQRSTEAQRSAIDAKTSADSLAGLLGDLSGKLPVAVMGLVFILAGAWIDGLINLSISAAPK